MKLALRIGLSALALLLVAGLAVWWLLREPPPLQPAHFPKPADARAATLQDLDYLKTLPDHDRSFTPGTRAAFEAEVEALRARAGTLDRAGLEMAVSHAVALAGNGHSNTRGVLMGRGLNALPVRLAWFRDGLYIVRAKGPELLGARVAAIEGRTPEAVVQALRPYVGGVDALARLYALNLMVSPQALHAVGLAAQPDEETLTLQTATGMLTRTLPATPRGKAAAGEEERTTSRDLSPEPSAGEEPGWRHVLEGRPEPLWLRQPDRHAWSAWPDDRTLYVAIRRVRSQKDRPLDAVLKGVLGEAARRKPRFAVIDLRASPGGDDLLIMDFTKKLPRLIPADGRIFILVGPTTFSAGLETAARLKYFAGSRGVMIGQPLGDRPRFWAEGARMTLPNSKVSIRYADGYRDWQTGCPIGSRPRCFWVNYLYGVAAGDLAPQVRVEPRLADYAAGRDPVMEAVDRIKSETPR